MRTTWQKNRKKEYYYKKAKKEGFRARSSYKLLQIDKKHHIFKNNIVILDLGCAPGGWLQVCKQKCKGAYILGVDLENISKIPEIDFIKGDITQERSVNLINQKLPKKADLILSDCSPSVSGNWTIDHARQVELVYQALDIAIRFLNSKGIFVCKVFQGEEFNKLKKQLKKKFLSLSFYKPKASRKKSSEIYAIAKRPKN